MSDTSSIQAETVPQTAPIIQKIAPPPPAPTKTVHDWVRDLRMNAEVNKTTTGVATDRVTPELMMATAKKLLAINRREAEPDPKDSLEFQRVYGATDYVAEHVLRDANRVGRQLLWKATNKGNVDFMPTAALDQHVSDVFNHSKMANMVDGSSPLELVEASYKVSRIGEGGIAGPDSAPTEMRLVQPSFLGYIDPVRSVESLRVGLDAYMTKNCMKGSDGKLYQTFINARTGKPTLVDSVTAAKSVITTPEMMQAKTNHIYALGGDLGVRIVKKSDVDYYLPDMDEAFTKASNAVTGLSGVKELRLLMGCLHPQMNVVTISKRNEISIIPAKDVNASMGGMPGIDAEGDAVPFQMRTTVAKFPLNRSWFRKIVLYSGRALVTSRDHRWTVLKKDHVEQIPADRLHPGCKVLRSTFCSIRGRRTFLHDLLVNKDIATMLGCMVRSLRQSESGNLACTYQPRQEDMLKGAVSKLKLEDVTKFYNVAGTLYMSVSRGWLYDWLVQYIGIQEKDRKIPSCILSARSEIVSAFLDSYTADETKVGMDALEYIWILDIPNALVRDGLAFLLQRIGADTYYRDGKLPSGETSIALKVVEQKATYGDCIVDEVKAVELCPNAPIMIDIDIDDNMYAVANGIVTHNSKYPQQAVSVTGREAPYVRQLDSSTGKDTASTMGRFLGARYASKPGTVTAVRADRIDLLYDDGTKGSVALYRNFPMNAKGFIDNIPQVKAGMHVDKDTLLASSNYTDDKGIQATGANLRTGWLSWRGGTYEDAIVLSESAAKKLTSTTMYSNDLDLDKTVSLGKKNYLSWKPGEYTKEQLAILDDDGVVKPGMVLHKGDPMVLAVQTSEPSPGTMGKRVLTDLSQTWEHDHPGVVTDIVKAKGSVKVLATVTAPVEQGDKLSGCFDDKTEIFTDRGFRLFKDLSPEDKVAVLHPDGSATFEYPQAYQADYYSGCMIEYKSRRASMKVTPNHDVACVPRYAYEQGNTRLIKRHAADIYKKRIAIRVSANFDGCLARPSDDYITLPAFSGKCRVYHDKPIRRLNRFTRDDYAAFLGLYLAEGHCAHKSGERWIRISQRDDIEGGKERCDQIENLLCHMGVEHHYYDHQYFLISNWPLQMEMAKLGNSYQHYVPGYVFSSWSKRDMETLLDWYYLGDGEKDLSDDGSIRCATVSQMLANDLQRLYILVGKYSNLHCTNAVNATEGRVYKISSAYKEFLMLRNIGDTWHIDTEYSGMVYCVTTSTGIVLTRRDGIISWNGQSYGNKGIVSQILPDDQMPHDKDGKPLEMLLSPLGLVSRCYDDKTEFLTREGWKLGADVSDEDLLYCYDPEDNTWSWDRQLTPMHKFTYRGIMYGGKNRLVDFLVSPGHKVWAKSDYPKAVWKETQIDKIFGKRYYIPCVASAPRTEPQATDFHLPTIPIKFKDTHTTAQEIIYDAGDWAEFLGWFLAEGNVTYNESTHEYRTQVAQSSTAKPENVRYLHKLLTRLGFTYHYTANNRQFHINGKRLAAYLKQFGKCHEKFVPDWVFQQPMYVIRRFLSGLWAGDGRDAFFPNHTGKIVHVRTIGLTSERLIDQTQALLAMCGDSAQKHPVKVKRPGKDKPLWRLGVSTVGRTCRLLRDDDWYQVDDYDGILYCPSVPSGYIMTRRNGKTICMGNCNPSQLTEALLGKVAHKTGKPEVIPAFYNGNMRDHVLERLKQNHLSADDDFFDPETGRKLENIVNGYSYIHKLKHLAESKESARGTDEYSVDETPGGSGYTGCFLARQNIMTIHGNKSIATICERKQPEYVLTYDGQQWTYKRVTDWFTYRASVDDILHIRTEYNLSDKATKEVRHHTSLYPTKNHKMYLADMSVRLAGDLKVGDYLASIGPVPTPDQVKVLYGTMLGDSHITLDGRLCCEHSTSQIDWYTYKYDALKGLGARLCEGEYTVRPHRIDGTGRTVGGRAKMLYVPRSAQLERIEQDMVRNRKRIVTPEVLDKLGELGLCVWFLDDGSICNRTKAKGVPAPEATLYTQGFTPAEACLIKGWLEFKLDLPDSIHMSRKDLMDGTEAYVMAFHRNASWKMAEMIARNIIWSAIPKSKRWLRHWCQQWQKEHQMIVPDFASPLGIVPVKVISIEAYKHDKPGITEVPVYDFTVDETHKYTLEGCVIVSNSKRFGMLEQSGMAAHGAFESLLDNKLIRGQQNSEFWRSIRTGGIPTIPGEPLVQKKFFAHLQGAGVNVRKTPKGISVFSLSNSDVNELAGPRELKSRDTYEAKNFRPIDGGLFGQDVFGINGDKWGYIQLDEPVPNPVMAEPLARLLRMTDKDFAAAASGHKSPNGLASGTDIKAALEKIDLDAAAKEAQKEFKDAPASKKDAMLKRYVAVERMRRAGVKPQEYMLDKIPVLPPIYRPISSHNGLTMVADANYLYAQMLDARDDLREAKDLPDEYQADARANLYRAWQELTGMYDPESVKLKNKNVGGLLQWALGKGSPKFSGVQRKVIGATVDTVGRGVIMPDSRLKLDQIGIPVGMAFGIMGPFVERALVNRGYSPVDAIKMVKRQDPQVLPVLQEVMKSRPVEMNRAPTLHKYNIMAFEPVLVPGHVVHVNPSVCPGFNADFDGDAVNIHVPVSDNARKEAMEKMRPSRNLITLSNHKIMYKPEKEYMQGLYIASRMGQAPNGRAQIFRTLEEARDAYRSGVINIDTPIQVLELDKK